MIHKNRRRNDRRCRTSAQESPAIPGLFVSVGVVGEMFRRRDIWQKSLSEEKGRFSVLLAEQCAFVEETDTVKMQCRLVIGTVQRRVFM